MNMYLGGQWMLQLGDVRPWQIHLYIDKDIVGDRAWWCSVGGFIYPTQLCKINKH